MRWILVLLAAGCVCAQQFANSYPQRTPADAAVVAQGKQVYEVNCSFCHGSDARGGDGGPNLIRSQLVLADDKGETIAPVIREGRAAQGMPKFEMSMEQIADIAAFLHSFRVAGYDRSRNRPQTIVVGDSAAGKIFFEAKCSSCHSATGDLAGIALRFEDPRTLQQRWLMSNGGRSGTPIAPPSAVITMPSGEKIEGRLMRVDDFTVSIVDAQGSWRSFRRQGAVPKVEIRDPLQGHKDLLPVYTDKDIHNVTAYLVTLR
jgi:mono/diheme cytochrome c family protein